MKKILIIMLVFLLVSCGTVKENGEVIEKGKSINLQVKDIENVIKVESYVVLNQVEDTLYSKNLKRQTDSGNEFLSFYHSYKGEMQYSITNSMFKASVMDYEYFVNGFYVLNKEGKINSVGKGIDNKQRVIDYIKTETYELYSLADNISNINEEYDFYVYSIKGKERNLLFRGFNEEYEFTFPHFSIFNNEVYVIYDEITNNEYQMYLKKFDGSKFVNIWQKNSESQDFDNMITRSFETLEDITELQVNDRYLLFSTKEKEILNIYYFDGEIGMFTVTNGIGYILVGNKIIYQVQEDTGIKSYIYNIETKEKYTTNFDDYVSDYCLSSPLNNSFTAFYGNVQVDNEASNIYEIVILEDKDDSINIYKIAMLALDITKINSVDNENAIITIIAWDSDDERNVSGYLHYKLTFPKQ